MKGYREPLILITKLAIVKSNLHQESTLASCWKSIFTEQTRSPKCNHKLLKSPGFGQIYWEETGVCAEITTCL